MTTFGMEISVLSARDVLVVDQDPAAASDASCALEKAGCVVHFAVDRDEALKLARYHSFDAALINAGSPEGLGLEVVHALRESPRPCCAVVMSAAPSSLLIRRVIRSGVSELLLKPVERAALLRAMTRAVHVTHLWRELSTGVNRRPTPLPGSRPAVVRQSSTAPSFDVEAITQHIGRDRQLTARERDVLRQMLRGRGVDEMVNALDISENTVKFHIRNILRKLQLRTRAELFRLLAE
jgi:DNA-binding NarL/FixJ family response regulator